MERDWFMYHLRSNFKNRLEFPFKLELCMVYLYRLLMQLLSYLTIECNMVDNV